MPDKTLENDEEEVVLSGALSNRLIESFLFLGFCGLFITVGLEEYNFIRRNTTSIWINDSFGTSVLSPNGKATIRTLLETSTTRLQELRFPRFFFNRGRQVPGESACLVNWTQLMVDQEARFLMPCV